MKIKILPIVLAMSMSVLIGCSSGATSYQRTKIEVTPEFLTDLASEQPGVEKDYPNTATVVDDWIVQNEPD